jgi:hypothetical protein
MCSRFVRAWRFLLNFVLTKQRRISSFLEEFYRRGNIENAEEESLGSGANCPIARQQPYIPKD